MRTILLLSILLLAVGSFAAVVQPRCPNVAEPGRHEAHLEWVRTADGWERPVHWQPPAEPYPELHPFVVTGLVAMAATAGLLWAAGPNAAKD